MFERFTERARRTIFHAKFEALSRESSEIEPKDIALGLTWDSHQPNCPFANIHDNAEELRALIGSGRRVYGPPQNRDTRLSKSAKKVLVYAAQEADLDRSRHSIGSDHLFRGILRNGDETASKMAAAGYTTAICECPIEAQRLYPATSFLQLHQGLLAIIASLILFIVAILYLHSQN